jgi:HSP20 family protein
MVPSDSGDPEVATREVWFSRLAGSYDWYLVRRRRVWRPPTDVYETEQYVVVKVEVAGMSEDDFEISLDGQRLVIAGKRGDPAGKLIYQNMEINYGDFRSEVVMSCPVEDAAVEATYEAGFLFVKLPKVREHHVRLAHPDQDNQ